MGTQGKWEQQAAPAENLGTDSQVGGDVGQTSPPAQDPENVSAGNIAATVKAEVERALASAIGPLRQDLETGIERQVQSFSDKAEYRITESTRQKLATLKEVMEGLRTTLGPDWEAVNRRSRTDILLANAETPPATTPDPTQQPAATNGQPAQTRQEQDGQASAYLAEMLGDPSNWTPQEVQTIQSELAQAKGYWAWIRVVNKHAALKPQRVGAPAPGASLDAETRAARAQPLSGGNAATSPDLDQLVIALNKAYTAGDNKEIDRINLLIDQATGV